MPFPVIEYQRIIKDREIGYLNTWSSEVHLACTIAHEVAHAFHCLLRVNARLTPDDFIEAERKNILEDRGHGDCWRAIYRNFRVEYVNKMAGV